ncbi:DMT family transporter [Desulfobulbus rhabdoformis]|uniref:DMT family transporter n=1 Tax=Desulfobulbus rhabdoformis TaxID=34032 RepID=UPI0019667F1D|nr:DMT family transporter [Desulfobulbus rhabdoformis]MBM9616884.1 DMT family transporter [Desulfobulbus rhabdoformis]
MKHAPDRTRSAVITIIFTVFLLALGDAIIKGISANFTLWQIFFLRSIVVVPILLVILKFSQWHAPIWPKLFWWTVLRSFLLTLMWVAYYASLPHINLSVAAAAYYTLPIFITIFAAIFLGDTIGKIGWLAIVLGFVGVLMVLQPRIVDFNWYALLPISSAILYALAMILTRSRCKFENIFVLSLWLNLSMFFIGAVISVVMMLIRQSPQVTVGQEFLIGSWSEMGIMEWVVIAALSVAILIGSIGAAYAYQNGTPATIATFDFAYVAFALIWGLILFQEIPSAIGSVGIFLIVFAGILAVRSTAKRNASPNRVAGGISPQPPHTT